MAAAAAAAAPQPAAIDTLNLLAPARLAPYKQFFKPATDEELLGCYRWAEALSASFHPLLSLAETVLREAIHQSLSLQCSGGASTSFAWYDRAVPTSVPLHGKSKDRVEEQLCEGGNPPLRKAVQPVPGAVIAALSIGFWPNVMEGLSQRFAPRTFTDVFPHYPHSTLQHWSKIHNKIPVVERLKRLQDLRNRVCHLEPVWKAHWLGLDPQTQKHWSHAVQALRHLHRDILELLGWCAPAAVAGYKISFGHNWFSKICTTDAVFAFMDDHASCAQLPSFPKRQPVAPVGAPAA